MNKVKENFLKCKCKFIVNYQTFLFSADYQSAKAARRVNRKTGIDDQEKVRHISGASHCSSDKSVGDLDAAESLIVLSSTNGDEEKGQNKIIPNDQLKSKTTISVENSLSNQSKDSQNMLETKKNYSVATNAKYLVNGNAMDLSPANIPHMATNSMHIGMQNHSLQQAVTSIPSSSKMNNTYCGSKLLSTLTAPSQNLQNHHHPAPHRQVMTVSGPVTDHVALVDTVLNQPSAPTMVIPMDESDHRINRVNPNTMVFSGRNFNGGSLISGER